MPSFIVEPGSAVTVRLEAQEAALLRNLLDEMYLLLGSRRPGDPVVERLFPRAYEKEEDESTFRELVGSDLAEAKKNALGTVEEVVGKKGDVDVPLSREQADDWLVALTDLRLAVGTRLGVTEETMGAEIDPDDADASALAILQWLGWMQESIVEALSSGSESQQPPD